MTLVILWFPEHHILQLATRG